MFLLPSSKKEMCAKKDPLPRSQPPLKAINEKKNTKNMKKERKRRKSEGKMIKRYVQYEQGAKKDP